MDIRDIHFFPQRVGGDIRDIYFCPPGGPQGIFLVPREIFQGDIFGDIFGPQGIFLGHFGDIFCLQGGKMR